MIQKFKEITQAWIAATNPTPEQRRTAERRAVICNGCNARTLKKVFGAGEFYICGDCGCPLSKKIFSPYKDSCPRDKWDR